MADNPLPIDEIEDYFFGRLTPAAGRRFQARLLQDAALRRHVQELEEAALALALAAPQLRPPSDSWAKIQAGVAPNTQLGSLWPILPLNWLFKVWPLAAGLMVAVCIHLAPVRSNPSKPLAAPAFKGGKATKNIAAVMPSASSPSAPLGHSRALKPAASAPEAVLEAVSLARPGGRITRGDQAGPLMVAQTVPETKRPSAGRHLPCLPRAVALALSRRMGMTNHPDATVQGQALTETQTSLPVDYVELSKPVAVAVAEPASLGAENGDVWSAVSSTIPPGSTSGTIAMFASDNDLVVAIDPATLSAHAGTVTIWVEDAEGNQSIVGTVKIGVNLMVINIQNAALDGGGFYTVKAGGTNVLGCFPW
jgi:hypothetical protein